MVMMSQLCFCTLSCAVRCYQSKLSRRTSNLYYGLLNFYCLHCSMRVGITIPAWHVFGIMQATSRLNLLLLLHTSRFFFCRSFWNLRTSPRCHFGDFSHMSRDIGNLQQHAVLIVTSVVYTNQIIKYTLAYIRLRWPRLSTYRERAAFLYEAVV